MLTHIVMMKFNDSDPNAAQNVKDQLMSLPPKIEQIRHYEVGIDIVGGDTSYDLVLISKFDSLETMTTYQVHPAHVEVLNYIKQVAASVVKVDYES